MSYFPAMERLLLTLWAGCVWAVGYLAVPMLFSVLDDRQLAGELAGQMFRAVSFIGLACGSLLLLSSLRLSGAAAVKQWRTVLLLVMLVLVAAAMFIVQPLMADIKAIPGWSLQSELKSRFGLLHGVSSLMYMVVSVALLALVVAGRKPS